MFLNDGAGRFEALPDVLARPSPHFLAAADMNGDGRNDLVIPHRGGAEFSVMLHDGQLLGFSDRWVFDLGGRDGQSIAIGDFNRDGRPDVAGTGHQSGTVSVFLNATGGGGGGDPAPTAPANLMATPTAADRIRVDWQDRSSDESGFQLERATGNGAFAPLTTTGANATSLLDTTVLPNNRYSYRIRAAKGSLFSAYVGPAEGLTFPASPTNLSLAALALGQIDLRWTDPNQPRAGTELERSSDGSATFSVIATPGPTSDPAGRVTFRDTAVTGGRNYVYRTRARNATGLSLYSSVLEVVTLLQAPLDLTQVGVTQTSVELRWRDPNTPTVPAELERSDDGGATFTVVATPGATTDPGGMVNITDSGLMAGRTYQYRTRARNSAGFSPYSSVLPVTTPVPPPTAPSALAATVVHAGRIGLSWADRSTNETGFRIERKTGGGNWGMVQEVAANTVGWSDTAATSGVAYQYRVRAQGAGGLSEPSNEVTATIPTGGVLSVTPTALRFGTLAPGRTKVLTVTLRNPGRGELVGRVGALDPPFRILSGAGPYSLPVRGSRTVRVEYAPQATGAHSGTLVITSTDPARAVTNLAATGARR